MSLQVQFLPARQGDAIWVRWPGHQLLIDLGTEQTGRAFRERLTALPADQRRFDLLVITHVDSDHIGGVLSCFADADEELPGLSFGDVWFNGWEHLHGQQVAPRRGERALEGMGPAQGERLASWLRKQPWNEAFDRFPAACSEDALPTVHLPGGLALTVLGPTASRLAGLRQT
jgi:glyoxylase-like metal-dependent hydrolase (beta-lactamase superfamily II)